MARGGHDRIRRRSIRPAAVLTVMAALLAAPAASAQGGSSVKVDARTEAVLEQALRYLAAHQAPNGGWDADGYAMWCDGVRKTKGKDLR